MKNNYIIWLLLLLPIFATAQHLTSFDPETDTIALSNSRGVWKVWVPENTLIAAAQVVTPELDAVFDVRIQDVKGKPYLFFKGKNHNEPEKALTVMVRLVETGLGVWKTGNMYQACKGEYCSQCNFVDYMGCACEQYNAPPNEEPVISVCNHMITIGKGLGKIEAER